MLLLYVDSVILAQLIPDITRPLPSFNLYRISPTQISRAILAQPMDVLNAIACALWDPTPDDDSDKYVRHRPYKTYGKMTYFTYPCLLIVKRAIEADFGESKVTKEKCYLCQVLSTTSYFSIFTFDCRS